MTEQVRAHVIVSGRVQGVFFRAETKHAAERFGVNGWVRNLPDGSVEAVFEGLKQAVDDAVAWCQHGPPSARVAGVKLSWEQFLGEPPGFSIRR
ncbi:MAG: acylphosphatase [Desulfobacteraceae bacterium]|nr:acylphosphatase [Desulfobacteraceae bacterium]